MLPSLMIRHRLAWLFALAALLAVPACDPGLYDVDAAAPRDAAIDALPPGPDAGPPAELDAFIEYEMAVGGIPGAALAIVRPTGPAWTGTYGYADIESERLVDEHTLFIMASVSKTLAATRAMQLVELGLLDLDEPVDTYLGYPMRHPGFPDTAITTRMLLTHTSGLEDAFGTLAEVTTVGDPTETLTGFARGYVTPSGAYYDADANWGAAPGTAYSYANAGFGVVGAILEGAGGAPFSEQSGAAIFEPLLMDGCGWFLSDVDEARVATPYGYNGRGFNPLPQNGFAYYPASSLRVSVVGLGRFASALLAGGELDGARVLENASVDEMLRLQVPSVARNQALAFSERSIGGHRYIGHSGSTFGGSTQLLLSRDGAHAILLMTNSDAYIRSRLGLNAGDDALDRILERLDLEARAL